jgi:hypothetical protein
MSKSQMETLREIVNKIVEECCDFQRRHPDVPQGDLFDLSEDELEELFLALQLHKGRYPEEARPGVSCRFH